MGINRGVRDDGQNYCIYIQPKFKVVTVLRHILIFRQIC